MTTTLRLLAAAACLGLVPSAWSQTAAVDSFSAGVTQVTSSMNGFGSTVDPGIQNILPGGDPARYFSWSTTEGSPVSIDNQSTPGLMKLRHAGGNDYSYVNLSYLFSVPGDLTAFSRIEVLGQGSGAGSMILALTDSTGDTALQTFAMAGGPFGNVSAEFSGMVCDGLGNGSCDFASIAMIEFYAGGFAGHPYAHDIDAIQLATGAAVGVVTPVPEPQTFLLMFAGLCAIGFAMRRRGGAI